MRALLVLTASVASAWAQMAGGSRLLTYSEAYSGIGRLRASLSCTAFFVRTADSGPAYAVAAGHCFDLAPNPVWIGQERQSTVAFRYFVDSQDRQLVVRSRRIAYSTMKGYDVSIIELDATHRELVAAGIRPWEIADAAPRVGEPVEVVGAPASGVPPDEAFLRRGTCELGAAADLVEFNWHFWGAYRNHCPDIYGGVSGSPVISLRTRQVVAVMNTTTFGAEIETGDFPCHNGQPCEIVPGGHRYLRDTNYAIPIHGVGGCFDPVGGFDLNGRGCPLDPGGQLDVSAQFPIAAAGARWNVGLSGASPLYRYKVVEEGGGDCRDAAGYGPALRVVDAPRITEAIPDKPARHMLCVLAGEEPRFASVVHVRIDNSPPSIPIRYVVRDFDSEWSIDPLFVVPDLVNFQYKVGGESESLCDDPVGYQTYRRIPVRVSRQAHRLCIVGSDYADNWTPPLELLLNGAQIFPDGVANAARWAEPGVAASGSWVSAFGVNLESDTAPTLTDAAGTVHQLHVGYQASLQVNALLPTGVALGHATLRVSTASAPLRIVRASPGVLAGSMFGDDLVLYVTGLASASIREVGVLVSGVPLELVSLEPWDGASGVERLVARPKAPLQLQGYVPVFVEVEGRKSNRLAIRVP